MEHTVSAPLGSIAEWVLVALRVFMGIIFLKHGIPKIKDLKKTGEAFTQMGFKPGIFWGSMIALLETFGSVMLIIGLFYNVIAALFAIHMLVGTIWKITATEKGFDDWSYDVLLLGFALVILALGPGAWVLFSIY